MKTKNGEAGENKGKTPCLNIPTHTTIVHVWFTTWGFERFRSLLSACRTRLVSLAPAKLCVQVRLFSIFLISKVDLAPQTQNKNCPNSHKNSKDLPFLPSVTPLPSPPPKKKRARDLFGVSDRGRWLGSSFGAQERAFCYGRIPGRKRLMFCRFVLPQQLPFFAYLCLLCFQFLCTLGCFNHLLKLGYGDFALFLCPPSFLPFEISESRRLAQGDLHLLLKAKAADLADSVEFRLPESLLSTEQIR